MEFENAKKLSSHKQRNHADLLKCEICGNHYIGKQKIGFLKFVVSIPFIFSYIFGTHENLNKHIKTVHADGNFKCDECGLVFKNKDYLRVHVLSVHIKRSQTPTHKCESCGKMFHSQALVNEHYKRTHLVEPSTCDVCGKEFKNRSRLQNHLKTHDESSREKVEWKCEICDKSYTCMKSKLKEVKQIHLLTHEEKKFECDFCHKKYRRQKSLKAHIDADHKGIFNYKCERCNLVR